MQLTHRFTVPLDPAEAWRVLIDIERIAPCMPGARLEEVDGDEYRGAVKVKVGPITAQYRGVVRVVKQDRPAGRMVLVAEGRDVKGQGTAGATITATLSGDGGVTEVGVVADLTITGKVAQFGRGVLGDVSERLLARFVENLEATVLAADEPAGAVAAGDRTPSAPEAGPAPADRAASPRTVAAPDSAAVDLLGAAGPALLRRFVPVAAAGVVALVLLRVLRSARSRR
ncbi:carbon monoxide dehydrogenase subunit G [Streptosporangium violaceochromogenes]|nr:carbon monoxide dehydrogenase subunit G [Streptosporangium violaceochromogenes]